MKRIMIKDTNRRRGKVNLMCTEKGKAKENKAKMNKELKDKREEAWKNEEAMYANTKGNHRKATVVENGIKS